MEDVKENYQEGKGNTADRAMAKRLFPIWIQSSVIGNVIGIIPGAGMIMAIFMAYDQASRRCPNLNLVLAYRRALQRRNQPITQW